MTAAVDHVAEATAAAIAAWEDPPRGAARDAPPVLSIAALIEAFAQAMTAALADRGHANGIGPRRADPNRVGRRRADPSGAGHPAARIEHWAAWTVMAASLTELWSRLLLPPDAPTARTAAEEAEALRRRLLERARMRAAADWLERQPQLGRVVFARGGTA